MTSRHRRNCGPGKPFKFPSDSVFLLRLAILLVGLFMLIVAFVPWTQTITVTGQLSAYTPFDRPQDIEAQITGRIKKWHIFEGVRVKAGDVILELDDYDPNFMAPDLLGLLEQRKKALEDTRKAALSRADQLDKRIKEMHNLVKAAVPSAGARVLEAESKVREARQKIEASKIAVATAELNVDRHQQLAKEGLVSQRELELTIQSAIASKADLQGAQANLSAAEQGMKASSFGREQDKRRGPSTLARCGSGAGRIHRRSGASGRSSGRCLLATLERQSTTGGRPDSLAD